MSKEDGKHMKNMIERLQQRDMLGTFSMETEQPNHSCKTKARLQPDPFLNELTNMFRQNTEKGSVWVTLKYSSDKSKSQRNRMKIPLEFKCLIRATDGKKNISTLVGQKDHQKFQASYATILKARMTALKKRERKEKRKAKKTN